MVLCSGTSRQHARLKATAFTRVSTGSHRNCPSVELPWTSVLIGGTTVSSLFGSSSLFFWAFGIKYRQQHGDHIQYKNRHGVTLRFIALFVDVWFDRLCCVRTTGNTCVCSRRNYLSFMCLLGTLIGSPHSVWFQSFSNIFFFKKKLKLHEPSRFLSVCVLQLSVVL